MVKSVELYWFEVDDHPPDYQETVLVTDGKEVGMARRVYTDEDGDHWMQDGLPEDDENEWHDVKWFARVSPPSP